MTVRIWWTVVAFIPFSVAEYKESDFGIVVIMAACMVCLLVNISL